MLIIVAGGPGAGKTSFGRALGRRLSTAILLDKDVLASAWVDSMLERLNNGRVDRDSRFYWDVVRPLEYKSLLATALDNLALGKSVVAVAPFGPELRDPAWIAGLLLSLSASKAMLCIIWLATDAGTARSRMLARSDARDGWKLAHWDEYCAVDHFGAPRGDWLVLDNGPRSNIDKIVSLAVAEINRISPGMSVDDAREVAGIERAERAEPR